MRYSTAIALPAQDRLERFDCSFRCGRAPLATMMHFELGSEPGTATSRELQIIGRAALHVRADIRIPEFWERAPV